MTKRSTGEQQFTVEERRLRNLLVIEPQEEINDDSLNDPLTLRRGLELLYRARFGLSDHDTTRSIHINYDQLHPDLIKAASSGGGTENM